MARLIVSLEAQSDIRAILAHLRHNAGPVVAAEYTDDFDKATDLLTCFPAMGTPRPELGPEARVVMVKPYIVIYDHSVERDAVTVLRVVHGRRNITSEMIARRQR